MKAYQIVYKVQLDGFEAVHCSGVYISEEMAKIKMERMSGDELEDYPHDIWLKELQIFD